MRKFFCILIFWLSWFCSFRLYAGERTLAQKYAIAESVLREMNKQKTFRRQNPQKLKEFYSSNELSCIGFANGGFVVIANTEKCDPILGVSNTNFASQQPENFKWWLNTVEKVLTQVEDNAYDVETAAPSKDYDTAIDSLLSSTWGQGNPYNSLCPSGNGSSQNLYPTGCVATAMAQVMYYHRYPVMGNDWNFYSFTPSYGEGMTLRANFGETTYDWGDMMDSYRSKYTEQQATAVATLMLHCGIAVNMQYTASGSGAYMKDACVGLRKYFRYNKNMRLYERDLYNDSEWMNMIYKDLNRRFPVLYGGNDTEYGGHAFVIDGYRSDGLVHVNWGWNGSFNGYYNISMLNPGSYQFSESQDMLIGFCDSTVSIPYESQLALIKDPTVTITSSGYLSYAPGNIYNFSVDDFSGQIGLYLIGNDSSYCLSTRDVSNLAYLKGALISPSMRGSFSDSLPDGNYKVCLGSMGIGEKSWQPVRGYQGVNPCYILTVVSGEKSLSQSQDDDWAEFLTSIPPIKVTKSSSSNQFVEVYDLMGKLLYKKSSSTFDPTVISGRGVFIIKKGSKIYKILR